MAGVEENHKVFASNDVLEALGPEMTAFISARVGMPLVMIAPEDITPGETMSAVIDFLPGSQDNEFLYTKKLLNQHLERFNDLPADIDDYRLSQLAGRALLKMPSGLGIETDGDGINDLGIIIVPSQDLTKEQLASGLATLPAGALGDLPGTREEWMALVLMHEARHTHQHAHDQREDPLKAEIQADQAMIEYYNQALKEGLVKTANLPEVFMGLRAIGSFYAPANEHATSASVQSPDEPYPPKITTDTSLDHLQEAQEKVFYEIGKDKISVSDYYYAFDVVASKLDADSSEVLGKEKKLLEEISVKNVFKDPPPAQEEIDAVLDQLSDETRQKVEGKIREAIIHHGFEEAREYPHAMYETTRRLYEQGMFDDNPIGKHYAYEFLEAAKKHAPKHFDTENSPQTKLEPPGSQTGLAQQTTPSSPSPPTPGV